MGARGVMTRGGLGGVEAHAEPHWMLGMLGQYIRTTHSLQEVNGDASEEVSEAVSGGASEAVSEGASEALSGAQTLGKPLA